MSALASCADFVPYGTFFNNVLTAHLPSVSWRTSWRSGVFLFRANTVVAISYLRDHGNSFSSKAAAIVKMPRLAYSAVVATATKAGSSRGASPAA